MKGDDMRCSRCNAQMVEGHVGTWGPSLQLRFEPDDSAVFEWDCARIVAHACPLCGSVHFAVDPEALGLTRTEPVRAAHAALGN